jgi:hypothetical protein
VLLGHTADARGDVMIGYRLVLARDDGAMRHGSTTVDDAEVRARACAGTPCSARPLQMSMRMQMLDLMVGLSERLSLMIMPQYMSMDMDSQLIAGAPPSDSHVHFGHHASGGVGDTQFHALYKLLDETHRRWVLGLGLSAPTGDTGLKHRRSHQQDGMAMAYGMQTGSGTWDLMPSLTYLEQSDPWAWGGQLGAVVRLQERNEDGYALGDRWQASGWVAYRLTPQLAASLRGVFTVEGAVKGEHKDLPAGSAPPDFPANYGGRYGEIGLGLTLDRLSGAFEGSTLGIEYMLPVRSQVNGYQLTRSGGLALSWSHHF